MRLFKLLTLAMVLGLVLPISSVQAQKGGNGKPGGEDPPSEPPLPPIAYVESHVVELPVANVSEASLGDFNDLGMIVGSYYVDSDIATRRAYLFDPADEHNPSKAVDLNDVPMVGLDPEWFLRSAIGLNNNGLVVGYVAQIAAPSVRRGFVLDLNESPAQIFTLPDTDRGWVDSYARKVNDNGDVLGVFEREDGSNGIYLYQSGLRSESTIPRMDELPIDIQEFTASDLDNPPPGSPSTVVAELEGGGIASYTMDLELDFRFGKRPVLSDNGKLAGIEWIEEEVQVRKNKTEIVSTQMIFREVDGVTSYLVPTYSIPEAINDEGTIALEYYGTPRAKSFYHDDWGVVNLASIAITSNDLYGNWDMNNVGTFGFTEIAVSGVNYDTGNVELVILKPVELTD